MGKKEQALIEQLKKDLSETQKNAEILRDIAYRHEAQLARQKCEKGLGKQFYEQIKALKLADYYETAISIFSWEGLPESQRAFFNSKRLEKQISDYGKICLFKFYYTYQNAEGKDVSEWQFLALPFVGVAGTLNPYGEFSVVKPYAPTGDGDGKRYYGYKTVGVDCVIISDFFQFTQTTANISLTIKGAIETYCSLIAECEASKKVNRNWIKLPLLFEAQEDTTKKDYDAFVSEVRDIVEGVENYDSAIVSQFVKNLKITPTGIQYYGEELTQTAKDYENDLRNFLGIGVIKNETRERKITAEFEKTKDQYNINIVKRKQTRELALEQAKKIWADDFKNARIIVNLDVFDGVEEDEEEREEVREEVEE